MRIYLPATLDELDAVTVTADAARWTRAGRAQAVREAAQRYAREMETVCAAHPLQWFNFFDFWKDGDTP